MRITWSERKNQKNFKKHKVWFIEAVPVLKNPLTLMNTNDHPDGDRMEYIGHSENHRLLYVVTVENQDGDQVRIISARKATNDERNKYEEKDY